MSKSKPASAAKASKSDVLTKVKGAAVTKPAQSDKIKSKDLAKKVATKKEEKKAKKVPVKEPTPESSSEEEEEEESESESEESASEDESSEEESETEVETATSKATKVAPKDDSDEDSDSDESASDDEAPQVNGKTPKAVKAAAAVSDDESESDESEDDDDDEAVAKPNGAKAVEDEDDDEDEDSSEEEDSDESEEDEEEEKVEKKSSKRKAEDEEVPSSKKSKVEAVDTSRGPNLFVGNLSWNVDEDWLRQEFEEFGELSGVRLMTDRQTGRSKGFGYVEFVEATAAAKAHAAKQGAELDGRAMNVDFANARQGGGEKQDNRRKSYGDQLGEPTETLFLGNLSFDVTQEDLTEAFAPHGTVLGIRLPTDRETGAPKGFGYVTFASSEEATGALEAMQGGYVKSRPVRLDYSQPRQNNDSPRGGGGFGGGRGGRGSGFGGRGRGRGDFGGRGGRGGGRGGRGGSTNRGGFGDYSGRKTTF